MLRGYTGAVLLGVAASASAAAAPQYAVTFDAQMQRADVALCLAQAAPVVQFGADSDWAMRFISAVRRDGAKIETAGSGWRATNWQSGECLHYSADLHAIAQEHKPDVGWQIGADFVAAPQLWLLRPDTHDAGDAHVRVELPPGWSISAPWREAAAARSAAAGQAKSINFDIPATPADWSAAVAFGHFSEQRIELPGGVLRLTILDGPDAAERAKLRSWLDRVAQASLAAYGRLPLPEVQVLMIPVGRHDGAVMFGQSIRGQGNALELLVDPSRPAADFNEDWMAVHELSHLMHPYLGDRGAWLAEGLATYYQNVLRARSGLLTPAQAWDRLSEGFKRGARSGAGDTLEDVARDMHHSHAFQRVYWAGAAYWLTVDRDLRRSGTGATLETALARFRDCCLPAYREWKPEQFVARLDALADTQVFSMRYAEFAQMRQFPQWEKVYSDLGIRTGAEHLAFDDGAKDAAIRQAIMQPRAAAGAQATAGP